jgi:hypothetical protein
VFDVNITINIVVSEDAQLTGVEGLLTGINAAVGTLANWFQVATTLIPSIEQALSSQPDVSQLLGAIQEDVGQILSSVPALAAQDKMLTINTAIINPARNILDDLLSLPLNSPENPINNPQSNFLQVQNSATSFIEDADNPILNGFWTRPYIDDYTIDDAWFPSSGKPNPLGDPADAANFVYDPRLPLIAFCEAISIFVCTAAIFQVDARSFITDMVTSLTAHYEKAVAGLIAVPIPSVDASIIPAFLGAITPPGVLAMEIQAWHGEIGVVDIYSPFSGPFSVSSGGYQSPVPDGFYFIPTATAGAIIATCPTDVMAGIENQLPLIIQNYYRWFRIRMRLGNLARLKALYVIKGYSQVWSLIQKLRALSSGIPGTPLYGSAPAPPPPEVTDRRAHWRLSELDPIIAELNDTGNLLGYYWEVYMYEPSPLGFPNNEVPYPAGIHPISVENVVGRLLSVLANAENNPDGPPANPTPVPERPVSLRAVLAAVAF